MDEPRRIPLHRSLNRRNLLLGGDRELVLLTMLFAGVVGLTSTSFIQFLLAVVLWAVLHSILIRLARSDPQMRDVYTRHVQYKAYYAARSGMNSITLPPPAWKD